MPADANAAGDIFGGWVMAQMDLACGIRAAERAKGRVVTAAVKEMSFAKPMKIGDTLCIYTHINRVGRTSMTLKVEAWAQRYLSDLMEKVTDADFIMVALDSGQAEAGSRRRLTEAVFSHAWPFVTAPVLGGAFRDIQWLPPGPIVWASEERQCVQHMLNGRPWQPWSRRPACSA